MVCRSDARFLKVSFKKWMKKGRKAVLIALFLALPFFAKAWELSVGPPLGFSTLNSLTAFGNQQSTIPIKVKINDLEYGIFLGLALPFFTVEGFETIYQGGKWGGEVYLSYGGAFPLSLSLGGGIYALKLWDFGVRLEHTTLIAPGGKYLNYRADGPFFIRTYNLLLSYQF